MVGSVSCILCMPFHRQCRGSGLVIERRLGRVRWTPVVMSESGMAVPEQVPRSVLGLEFGCREVTFPCTSRVHSSSWKVSGKINYPFCSLTVSWDNVFISETSSSTSPGELLSAVFSVLPWLLIVRSSDVWYRSPFSSPLYSLEWNFQVLVIGFGVGMFFC